MSSRVLARGSAVVFALLLLLGFSQAAEADTLVTGTNTWTMVGTPSMVTPGGQAAGATSWSSSASTTVTAIVIIVVRNASNQTVYYSTATLTLAPGQISSAQDIIFGLPFGKYAATFFAFTFAGIAISTSTTVEFSLPL